jgi:hypothetical protein
MEAPPPLQVVDGAGGGGGHGGWTGGGSESETEGRGHVAPNGGVVYSAIA